MHFMVKRYVDTSSDSLVRALYIRIIPAGASTSESTCISEGGTWSGLEEVIEPMNNMDVYYGKDNIPPKFKYSYMNETGQWVHLCDCGTSGELHRLVILTNQMVLQIVIVLIVNILM